MWDRCFILLSLVTNLPAVSQDPCKSCLERRTLLKTVQSTFKTGRRVFFPRMATSPCPTRLSLTLASGPSSVPVGLGSKTAALAGPSTGF